MFSLRSCCFLLGVLLVLPIAQASTSEGIAEKPSDPEALAALQEQLSGMQALRG